MTVVSTEAALEILHLAHIALEPGLTGDELASIETRFSITFAPDHADLLRAGVPSGEDWPDWRNASDSDLWNWLDWPRRGVLFDVAKSDFWPVSWGAKPGDPTEALEVADRKVRLWPTMVPVWAHRYMAAGSRGRPIFSIHQSDVIYYGSDLADYFRRDFYGFREPPMPADPDPIWPWSDLACGAENADL